MSQTYANHTRWVPPYHFFALPVFLVNIGWQIYHLIKGFSADTVISTLLAFALFIAALFGRLFALSVQDRLIRLEMRLRMASVLPQDMRGRIPEFTVNQLVALRFASDEELPALARKVLDEKIGARKPIKQMVKNWQPDEQRA
ncbi:MAG: DUF6526 family protein [Candidatus Acidiferrales bacterium]